MSETFNFQGEQTTFINRPKNTIIADFQKKYVSEGTGPREDMLRELTRLVEIVAGSEQMKDSDKEDTLQALDSVAHQVQNNEENKLTLKGTLEAVKEIVGRVADISVPAMGVIASILKIAGLA